MYNIGPIVTLNRMCLNARATERLKYRLQKTFKTAKNVLKKTKNLDLPPLEFLFDFFSSRLSLPTYPAAVAST